ncbi:thioesterase II family protein [Phenylobacterium sp.]|uniref:thioesterase II family protein n=1 Tax=Phenylobacterium sp. TaxID=1871053 RepID=UPI002FC89515
MELLKPADGAPIGRVIFAPYAGSSCYAYYGIANTLPARVECLGFDYPGRLTRPSEAFVSDIQTLGTEFAEVISRDVSIPTVLFGHSMGAFVAYEAASRLAGVRDQHIAAVILSCQRPPQAASKPPYLHEMGDEDLVEELRRMGGVPDDVIEDIDALKYLAPILRSDSLACATYKNVRERVLPCPIHLYYGDEDESFSEENIAQWSSLTGGGVKARIFGGGHFYFKGSYKNFVVALNEDVAASFRGH